LIGGPDGAAVADTAMAAARTAPNTAVKGGIVRERIVASSVGRICALQAVAGLGPRRPRRAYGL
jgi:hypothetical protein